jgi:hypothetical protein
VHIYNILSIQKHNQCDKYIIFIRAKIWAGLGIGGLIFNIKYANQNLAVPCNYKILNVLLTTYTVYTLLATWACSLRYTHTMGFGTDFILGAGVLSASVFQHPEEFG